MFLLTTLFLGCTPIAPEEGIDNTRIEGMVVIPPVLYAETAETNNREAAAEELPPLGYEILLLDAVTARFGVDDEMEPTGDADWWVVNASYDFDGDLSLTLDDATATVRLELYDLDERIQVGLDGDMPTLLESTDIVGSGSLSVSLSSGVNYAVVVTGAAQGTAESSAYRIVFPSANPDDAGILVGAFPNADPADRGNPVAGSPVDSFLRLDQQDVALEIYDAIFQSGHVGYSQVENAEYTWSARYSMFLVRSVELTEDDETLVNEDVSGPVYVFAGAFANLNQGLPAGTFYSSTPVELSLGEDERVLVDPVVLDDYAPLVIGFSFAETEPNDMELTDASGIDLETGVANDVGMLSGPGFVDILTGTNPLSSEEAAWGIHDHDVFSFQVPVAQTMLFTLGWQNSADIDLLIYDDAPDLGPIDGAASFDNPEVGGGGYTYEPGIQYYLLVLGYSGDPADPPEYELRLEQIGAR